jgi:hypothetical protein
MANWGEILFAGFVTTVAGGTLTYYYGRLASDRQHRQALEQKVIERLSSLVETYYGQITFWSHSLAGSLNSTVGPAGAPHDRSVAFYALLAYLYHVDRLNQDRPIPLLTAVKSEQDYLAQTAKVYDCLPFDAYQVSLLIELGKKGDKLVPLHVFVDKIPANDKTPTSPELTALYQAFAKWLDSCVCPPESDGRPDCAVHRAIKALLAISINFDNEVKKAYALWYRKKR